MFLMLRFGEAASKNGLEGSSYKENDNHINLSKAERKEIYRALLQKCNAIAEKIF